VNIVLILATVLLVVNAKVLWCDNFSGDWKSRWGTVSGDALAGGRNSIVNDPQEGAGVLEVVYKKGTIGGTSGAGFKANPAFQSGKTTACLGYKLKFESSFDWVKGGKLPGLAGFVGAQTGCSGGKHSPNCFSTRYMWRREGFGTIYAYIPSKGIRCNDPDVTCNSEYGNDLGNDIYQFPKGQWVSVFQEVKLNDIGKSNGYVKVWFNTNRNVNAPTYTYDKAVIRELAGVKINAIMFSTFFGGSDNTWAPKKDSRISFTDFILADSCADIFAVNAQCSVGLKALADNNSQQEEQIESSPASLPVLPVALAVALTVFTIIIIVIIVIVVTRNKNQKEESV